MMHRVQNFSKIRQSAARLLMTEQIFPVPHFGVRRFPNAELSELGEPNYVEFRGFTGQIIVACRAFLVCK